MKKLIFFISILAFYSCKKEDNKVKVAPITASPQTDSMIYSSKSFAPHLSFNAELSEYELIELKNPNSFKEEELIYPVKENDFELNKVADLNYYTPFTFNLQNVSYAVIAYYSYGDNDIKVANIQLNSYLAGKQTDAILLDCRFTFETEYYREFTISKNGIITINKVAIDGLNYNEEGDIVGEKAVKDTTIVKSQYKLNTNGAFVKM
jgi:hypothetical protein